MSIESSTSPSAGPDRRLVALIFAASLAFTLSLAGSALKSTVQVYFASIADGLGTGVGAFAWSTTTFAIGIAIASPLVGAMADRWGGAVVLVTGSVFAGAAFLICAVAPGVLLFASTYGIVGSLSFTMLSYVPLGKIADELFAERGEGLAYAAMTNGPAVGFIVLVPLWVWLGTFVDWRVVFVVAGIAMLVVLTPLALLLMRLSAQDAGQTSGVPEPATGLTTRDRLAIAVGNRTFVVLAIAFAGCGVTMAFVDVHLVTDLDMAGMHPTVVSGTLFLLGVFELLGALIAGRLCDRGLIKQTLVGGYALRGTAMLLLAVSPVTATALGFGVVFGASYMVTVVATTLWVARVLPAGARATAMGLVWTLHSLGAAASSQLGAYAAQSFGSYTQVSLAEAIVVLISLVLVSQLPASRLTSDGPPTAREVPTPVQGAGPEAGVAGEQLR